MIDVEGLTKYYGPHRAIHDVSFQVKRGEIVAFLGPNAAGKSTTMRILTGFLPASSGSVHIAGNDIYTHSVEARRHIGYVPEHPSLYPDMRVKQYLGFCGGLYGMSPAQIREARDRVVQVCGLAERYDYIIGRLSLGYRQRVCLAQALLHEPDVLILDEPTLGLDPNQIVQVRELIKSLAGDHTVMLSTHILPEAQAICERVIIINHGEIIAEDTPQALTAQLRQARTVYVRVQDDSSEVSRTLLAVPEVIAVEPVRDDRGAYYVNTKVGSDLRSQIAKLIVDRGWGLLELRVMEMSLEDVFRHLTTREEGVA
jgi:ABC-2 type transport system ATP-binding protein